jgi:hypothetical protein
LLAAAGILASVGCLPDDEPRWPPGDEIIEHLSSELDGRQYTITLTGKLDLPGWGEIDGATFAIDAVGDLRAGVLRADDAAYELHGQGGQTFFRREGCDAYARVPGGGADVLRPFMLAAEIRTATDLRYPVYAEGPHIKSAATLWESPPAPPYIRARLAYLGDVRIADADGVRQIQGETFVMHVEYAYDIPRPLVEPIVPALGDRAPGSAAPGPAAGAGAC